MVFDFETGGLTAGYHEAIQVAGKAYNGRTLEPIPDGEFCSLMKPLHPDRLDPKALEVNRKSVDDLMKAPDQGVVWKNFVDWVGRFNKKKSKWTAPIAAGKNIRHFDMAFVDVLNELHMPKGKETVLFNVRRTLDLEDHLFYWFENNSELVNEKMDTVREYFGMSTDGAHDALVDVRQTGDLLIRFMKLYRRLAESATREKSVKLQPFKGAFSSVS